MSIRIPTYYRTTTGPKYSGNLGYSLTPATVVRRRRTRAPASSYRNYYAKKRTVRTGINQRTSGFVGAAGDYKYFDTGSQTWACDTTGSIYHMDIVTQGTTVNSRDGKSFRDTSIQIRGRVTNGSTAVGNDIAIVLLWDKQPNKALAAITDILDTANVSSMNKRENASRFTIIRRWDMTLTGKSDGTSTPGYLRNFDKYVKLPRDCIATCTTADATGAIGNRISGALLMLAVGNNGAGTAAASLIAQARINFVDC